MTSQQRRNADAAARRGMNRNLKNRFDVQVVFHDFAFGIKNRPDVVLTPDDVATALEEFCQRVRNGGKLPDVTE